MTVPLTTCRAPIGDRNVQTSVRAVSAEQLQLFARKIAALQYGTAHAQGNLLAVHRLH